MSLFCDDGEPAQITPWVPIPPGKRGAMQPLEHERDRCQRCGKVAWQHWNEPAVASGEELLMAACLANFFAGEPMPRVAAKMVGVAFAKLLSRGT